MSISVINILVNVAVALLVWIVCWNCYGFDGSIILKTSNNKN